MIYINIINDILNGKIILENNTKLDINALVYDLFIVEETIFSKNIIKYFNYHMQFDMNSDSYNMDIYYILEQIFILSSYYEFEMKPNVKKEFLDLYVKDEDLFKEETIKIMGVTTTRKIKNTNIDIRLQELIKKYIL